QSLDGDAGVIFRILDEAEEQEIREVLLSYFYLWRYAGERGWTAPELDDYVELDLEKRLDMKIDFEIGHAVRQLEVAGIATVTTGRCRAVQIETAQQKLDHIWERNARSE